MNEIIEDEKINIVGLVVNARVDKQELILQTLASIAGVDVSTTDNGKIIITVDNEYCESTAVDTITQINNISGVMSTSIAYHHFEGGLPSKENQK
jgi:nitrate reductase NapD